MTLTNVTTTTFLNRLLHTTNMAITDDNRGKENGVVLTQ